MPFFGDDRFSKLSPLRRIPVLVDGDLVLTNSSVICEYLEDLKPEPALYPKDIRDRARARWLEEFADTRMGDVFIWRYFNQIAIRPSVWGEKGDKRAGREDPEPRTSLPCWTISRPRRRRRAFASARCRSPTSRQPASSAPPPSCASRSTPRAGRGTAALDGAHAGDAGIQEARGDRGRRRCARRSPSSATSSGRWARRSVPRPTPRPLRGAASCRSSARAPHPVVRLSAMCWRPC